MNGVGALYRHAVRFALSHLSRSRPSSQVTSASKNPAQNTLGPMGEEHREQTYCARVADRAGTRASRSDFAAWHSIAQDLVGSGGLGRAGVEGGSLVVWVHCQIRQATEIVDVRSAALSSCRDSNQVVFAHHAFRCECVQPLYAEAV